MKEGAILVCIFIFSITQTACSSYKAREDGFSGIGYEEKQLGDGTIQLTYYGSTFDSHDAVEKLWHQRANELCHGNIYKAATEKAQWEFDAYTILPPLLFINKASAPSIEGKLRCNPNPNQQQNIDKGQSVTGKQSSIL